VTVNLSTFIELLMAMAMTQKIYKSGWVDPSYDWGQREAKTRLKMQVNSRKQGKRVTGCLQKGALP